MKKVKVIILRTAGTNCDYETDYAFKLAGAETELVHVNQLLRGEKHLSEYSILAIPGGFSYGDDISAGILLANELKYKLSDQLEKFVADQKLVIGICNGFQVLVKSGLLRGENGRQSRSMFSSQHRFSDGNKQQNVTLSMNDSGKFECRWSYLKTEESPCVFTKGLKKMNYLPVAHAEGKFMADEETLNCIEKNCQVVFRYVDQNGKPTGYPGNPNGSLNDIAGICDRSGRIFGLMPHPERYVARYNHPRWTREELLEEGDGLAIFRNAVEYVE